MLTSVAGPAMSGIGRTWQGLGARGGGRAVRPPMRCLPCLCEGSGRHCLPWTPGLRVFPAALFGCLEPDGSASLRPANQQASGPAPRSQEARL